MYRKPEPLFVSLARHIAPEPFSGCWLWMGAIRTDGYGSIRVGGKSRYAHRVCFEVNRGPIPNGLELDHLCRTRCCVNPAHLEPVTRRVNVVRGNAPAQLVKRNKERGAAVTHCLAGHPYTPENTGRTWPGSRYCRTCNRVRGAERYKRTRGEVAA